MTSDTRDKLKAKADAVFRTVALQEKDNAMGDYRAAPVVG
jgi:hypothetical protein